MVGDLLRLLRCDVRVEGIRGLRLELESGLRLGLVGDLLRLLRCDVRVEGIRGLRLELESGLRLGLVGDLLRLLRCDVRVEGIRGLRLELESGLRLGLVGDVGDLLRLLRSIWSMSARTTPPWSNPLHKVDVSVEVESFSPSLMLSPCPTPTSLLSPCLTPTPIRANVLSNSHPIAPEPTTKTFTVGYKWVY